MFETRRLRKNVRPVSILINLILLVLVAFCLLPIIWTVSSSLKGVDELFKAVPSLIPRRPTLANYRWMFTARDMTLLPTNLANSFKVSVGTVILTVVLSSMAGYAFARMEFWGREAFFYGLILAGFVPRAGGLMAAYEMMDAFHLRNSHLGLVLAFSAGLGVPVFIMRQTFLSIPKELEETALIDGANTWQLLRHVAIPLSTGGMIVVAVFTFVAAWGNFLFTITMIDFPELETLAVAITKVVTWGAWFSGPNPQNTYGSRAAAHMFAIVPVVLLFVLLQRWFVRGLREGILKF